MTKVYGTKSGSQYFFAQGVLVKIIGERAIRALEPRILYTTTAEISAAAAEYNIDLTQLNDADNLQTFFETLRQREISREKLNGRFIALGKENNIGRVLYTGEVVRFSERNDLAGRLPALGFT